jgi:uncharacterized protein YcbK (DUF882 family)
MPEVTSSAVRLSRRRFAFGLAAIGAHLVVPTPIWAGAPTIRSLRFAHLHTGERLEIEYFDGQYVPDALRSIDYLLRDFRTGDVHTIEPGLLDLLHRLSFLTETRRPFEVISGYRSPATNQMLRTRSEGVASGSLHMAGKAIDIRLGDVPLARLREAALGARGGGVGYYPASNFVHVDTGRVRTW